MKVTQGGHFYRAIKRLYRPEREILETAIKKLMIDPNAGKLKTGDLAGTQVLKFKINLNLMLLAYIYNPKSDVLNLLDYASHENFYQDLKRHEH